MGIIYTKRDQGRSITTGTGVPTHDGVAGDGYTDSVTGNTYQYTTSWQTSNSISSSTSSVYYAGTGLTLSGSTFSVVQSTSILATASNSTLGGVIVGTGLTMSNSGVLSSTTYTAGSGLTVSGSTFSSLTNTGNILYVASTGSDVDTTRNGHLGNIINPFLTLQAAKNAAIAGDTIYVFSQTIYFDNSTGIYNSNLSDLNLWKNGVTYYFEPGTKLIVTSYKNLGPSYTFQIFRPTGSTYETCKVLGYLEYEQYTPQITLGDTSANAVHWFYENGNIPGYEFYSQTKSIYAHSQEPIYLNRTATGLGSAKITIISDSETVIVDNNMNGVNCGTYINGGDNVLTYNSYIKVRDYRTNYSFSIRGDFRKSSINFFGKSLYSTGNTSANVLSTKLFDFRTLYGIVNVNIDKIYFTDTTTNNTSVGINDGNGGSGGFTLNLKGDIIEISATGSTSPIFKINTANNIINYIGNIYTNTNNGNTGRYISNITGNSTLNIDGNINYTGSATNTIPTFYSIGASASTNYSGKITGNFACPIANCYNGTININNSNIVSLVSGSASSVLLNGSTTLSTVKINNSYIQLSNSSDSIGNGSYVKALINNSTIINSGTASGISNTTNFGTLQITNSLIYATTTPINYTGTASVIVSNFTTNVTCVGSIIGEFDLISDLTF